MVERDEESCRLIPGLHTKLEMQYQLEIIKELRGQTCYKTTAKQSLFCGIQHHSINKVNHSRYTVGVFKTEVLKNSFEFYIGKE